MIEQRFEVHDLSIAYKQWGESKNQTIIAMHGWLDNANSFDLIAPILSKNYCLIAVDLPGHGMSSHIAPSCYYHFIDGIFYMEQFIRELELDSPWLLGHSMGACLSSLIAGVVPDTIGKMALIEGLGPLSRPNNTCRDQLSHFVTSQRRVGNKTHPGYANFEEATAARCRHGYIDKKLAAIILERGLYCDSSNRYHWRHDKRLVTNSPLRMTEEQILDCLKHINCPTLFIEAKQGFCYNEKIMKKRIEAVNNIELEVVEGGHHVHLETPDAIAQTLLTFFNQ